jgi:hypothetical protein
MVGRYRWRWFWSGRIVDVVENGRRRRCGVGCRLEGTLRCAYRDWAQRAVARRRRQLALMGALEIRPSCLASSGGLIGSRC